MEKHGKARVCYRERLALVSSLFLIGLHVDRSGFLGFSEFMILGCSLLHDCVGEHLQDLSHQTMVASKVLSIAFPFWRPFLVVGVCISTCRSVSFSTLCKGLVERSALGLFRSKGGFGRDSVALADWFTINLRTLMGDFRTMD